MTRRSLHRGRVGDFGLEQVRLPNGLEVELEILRHPGAAAVLPLHDDGSISLIRQHRHAAGGTIWEIPAGKLDPGEAPEVCAARELAEEAGLCGTLTPLIPIWTTPAFTDEVIHLFVATELRAVPSALEADEIICVERLGLDEAVAMVHRGDIRDAKSVCAILMVWARPPTPR